MRLSVTNQGFSIWRHQISGERMSLLTHPTVSEGTESVFNQWETTDFLQSLPLQTHCYPVFRHKYLFSIFVLDIIVLKKKPLNWLYTYCKGQFICSGEYFSVCKNNCIMSSVTLEELSEVWENNADDVRIWKLWTLDRKPVLHTRQCFTDREAVIKLKILWLHGKCRSQHLLSMTHFWPFFNSNFVVLYMPYNFVDVQY